MKDRSNRQNNRPEPELRTKRLKFRLGMLFIMAFLAFVALSLRLFFIVKNNNNEYQRRILSQQAYDSKTLTAKRGEIVDCNGTILATSKEQYNVILDVVALLDAEASNPGCISETVGTASKIFDVDANAINKYIAEVPTSRYYIVKKAVNFEEMNRFLSFTTKPSEENAEGSLYNDKVKGVWFEKYYVRDYPQGKTASHALGFYRNEGGAAYGLEEYYDYVLTGTDGRQFGFLSDETTLERTTIPAVDGNTIVSTIDTNVQMIVEKYIKQFAMDYKNNARDGYGANNIGCIVMRANTAEVVAMASYPDYDPNFPTDLSEHYSEEEIKALQLEGTFQNACDNLWKNYCISETYEPGSVMKPFTVAMGLETGKIAGNETYLCEGSLHVGDYDIFCHNRSGDGILDVKGAVAQSCNVALMKMVSTIGKDTFLKFQNVFNLGLKTNIDLSGEARTDTLVFTKENLGDTELATGSFGQGFNVSMIQMCAGYAALVNGGYYYEPHMVSKIVSPSGAVVKNIEPRLIKQVVSRSTSDKIVEYCNEVVADGTGWRAKPAGYEIGGKTGTAETLPRGNGEFVVSFIAHVPAINPEYIVYVVIDRPNVAVQEDAKYATIVSRQILTEILPYLGVKMTDDISDEEREELLSLELSIYTNRVKEEDAKAANETEEKSGDADDGENTNDEGSNDDDNAD